MMELLGFFAPSLEASKIFATAADHRGHRRCGMVPNGVRRGMDHPDHRSDRGNRGDDIVRRGRPGRVIGVQLLRGSGEAQ